MFRGKGHRAERNRAIVGAAALSAGMVGAIYGRRLIPQGLFRAARGGQPLIGKVQVLTKRRGQKSVKRVLDLEEGIRKQYPQGGGMHAHDRPASSQELGAVGRPFVGAKLAKAMGYDPELGTVRAVPWTARKIRVPLAEKFYSRFGDPTTVKIGGEERFRRLLPSLWRIAGSSGGKPRLASWLEGAERRALAKAGAFAKRPTAWLTAPKLPKGAHKPGGVLFETKKGIWKEHRGELLAFRKEFERTTGSMKPSEAARLSGKAADRVAESIAMERLRRQFPSRIERATKRVFGPLERRVVRANNRMQRRARELARRQGLA